MHGSLLPKNPNLVDKIIKLALERKGKKMPEVKVDNTIEVVAHDNARKLPY